MVGGHIASASSSLLLTIFAAIETSQVHGRPGSAWKCLCRCAALNVMLRCECQGRFWKLGDGLDLCAIYKLVGINYSTLATQTCCSRHRQPANGSGEI